MKKPERRPDSERPATWVNEADRAELEGFLLGIEHRLRTLRDLGRPDLRGKAELRKARRALDRGALQTARASLERLDMHLDETTPESELKEFPRGLVGYAARGDRGTPVPRDEEPVANRILLVGRLLELRRSQGWEVDRLAEELRAAETAYTTGERIRARTLCDRVHAALDAMGSPGVPSGSPESRRSVSGSHQG